MTDGGPRGHPLSHDEQTLLAMDVEVLGVAYLAILCDAVSLEETIFVVLVISWIFRLRKYCVAEIERLPPAEEIIIIIS
jgi:hypothetical protein